MNRYTTTLEDAKLLSLMQEDDINALTTLYERYWQKLYGVAWYHLEHKQAAEDIVQDIYCQSAGNWL